MVGLPAAGCDVRFAAESSVYPQLRATQTHPKLHLCSLKGTRVSKRLGWPDRASIDRRYTKALWRPPEG